MGSFFSSIYEMFSDYKNIKIVFLGLPNAGKTTILYLLKIGEVIKSIPTISFNKEEIKDKNVRFEAWDLAGSDNSINYWKYYIQGANAIIYVVDASDEKKHLKSKEILHSTLKIMESEEVIIAILSNKHDLVGCVKYPEFVKNFELNKIKKKWQVFETNKDDTEGYFEAMQWIKENIKKE